MSISPPPTTVDKASMTVKITKTTLPARQGASEGLFDIFIKYTSLYLRSPLPTISSPYQIPVSWISPSACGSSMMTCPTDGALM